MELSQESILLEYCTIAWRPLALEAMLHTIQVMDCMALLYPGEEGRWAALLHDYARFRLNAGHDHAAASARFARTYLEQAGVSPDAVDRICHAIARHSAKDQMDDAFCEALKDADVFARYLSDPGYAHPRLARIQACLMPSSNVR